MNGYVRAVLVIGAIVAAGMCIWMSLTHEADGETLEFTSDPEERTLESDSLTYCMVFTGELADSVTWDFGDGTTAEAFEVVKTYEEPGDYSVLCKASNDNGDRYSSYSLHITESEHGVLDGYGTELALVVAAVVLMIAAYPWRL